MPHRPVWFMCEIDTDAAGIAWLRALGTSGRINTDPMYVRRGRAWLPLYAPQIAWLRARGFVVEMGESLASPVEDLQQARLAG